MQLTGQTERAERPNPGRRVRGQSPPPPQNAFQDETPAETQFVYGIPEALRIFQWLSSEKKTLRNTNVSSAAPI